MTSKNINIQDWLNEKYPINGKCKRSSDPENKNKERKFIHKLDIQLRNVDNGKKNLYGDLKLEGFNNLKELNISNHNLNSLDISDCLNLQSLNISHNKNIKELNLSANLNLEEVNFQDCTNLKIESINYSNTELIFNEKENKLIKKDDSHLAQITYANNEVRNILIVGVTGSGKSSLANTLAETTEFKCDEKTTSVTDIYKKSNSFSWKFENNNFNYCIIDNIGLGDTRGVDFTAEVLHRIGQAIVAVNGEINQIIFTLRGRFDPFQIKMFNLFKEFINESEINKFTTLVVTGFENYLDSKKIKDDRQLLINESKEIRDLIESCNGILYVNNPGIDQNGDDEDENEIFQLDREESREIIMNHLAENCNQIFKLKEWKTIRAQVDSCLERIQLIENEINLSKGNSNKINELNNEKKKEGFKIGKLLVGKVNAKLITKLTLGIFEIGVETEFSDVKIQSQHIEQK